MTLSEKGMATVKVRMSSPLPIYLSRARDMHVLHFED